jgi:tetratricopeptide (TPR) repeat protein
MSADSVESLIQQAEQAAQRRDPITAVSLYRKALKLNPDSIEALEGVAMVYFQAGDLPAAIEKFARLTLLDPHEPRHYVNLGALYNRTDQHAQAADVLRKAIQRDRLCANAYYNLGIAQRKLGQQAMAISAYKEAIRLEPEMAEAYQNLANVYLDSQNYPLAIQNFKKTLELRPDHEKAQLGLSRAEEALEQSKAVKNPFGRIIDLLPAPPDDDLNVQDASPLDRTRMQVLAQEFNRVAEEFREQMKTQLEPRLHALQKLVAEGRDGDFALGQTVVAFQEAFAQWQQCRRELHQRAEELRDAIA